MIDFRCGRFRVKLRPSVHGHAVEVTGRGGYKDVRKLIDLAMFWKAIPGKHLEAFVPVGEDHPGHRLAILCGLRDTYTEHNGMQRYIWPL